VAGIQTNRYMNVLSTHRPMFLSGFMFYLLNRLVLQRSFSYAYHGSSRDITLPAIASRSGEPGGASGYLILNSLSMGKD